MSIPLLFAAGVAFGYFIVLPAAVRFFVNFNANEFNNLVQASQFYKFAATILLAMGVVFQVPVLIIGATRLEIVTVAQLRHNRRYAIVACAAVAAFLPGDFDHAAARDATAVSALRGEYPVGSSTRPAQRAA